MRDYDVFVYATADPRTGNGPEHLQYRFKHCVRALTRSALPSQVWRRSLDERLVYDRGCDLDGYVWGVKWQALYSGISFVGDSVEAQQWSRDLGLPFYEAKIETNTHNISLIFADLIVNVIGTGYAPFVVYGDGPDFKTPIP